MLSARPYEHLVEFSSKLWRMTRWLDDDEQRTWRQFLTMNELLAAALDRQLQRDAGMTHGT
jgi:hypothetical protein